MIKQLAFVAVPVSDVPRARAFYEGKLGLRLTSSYQDFWIEYDLGDTTFAIAKADEQHPVPVRGAVVAFEMHDLDAAVTQLKAAGVSFKQEVFETPVCRMAVALDPDENEIMLHQLKAPAPAPAGPA